MCPTLSLISFHIILVIYMSCFSTVRRAVETDSVYLIAVQPSMAQGGLADHPCQLCTQTTLGSVTYSTTGFFTLIFLKLAMVLFCAIDKPIGDAPPFMRDCVCRGLEIAERMVAPV